MGKFISFILGMIVGGILSIALLVIVGTSYVSNDTTHEGNEVVKEEVRKEPIHTFEVKKGSKYIELHTYMPKDSVALLYGKPDKVNMDYNEYSDIMDEKWIYENNWEIPEYIFEFENGKLTQVTSY